MDDPNPTPTTRVPTPSTDAPEGAAVPPAPAAEPTVSAAPPAPTAEPTFSAAPPAPPAGPGFAAVPPPPPPVATWGHRRRDRGDSGRIWTLIVGLFILATGVWFFLDRTLDLHLPEISWSQFWPVIVIAVGVAVLLGALRRERS